MADKERSEKFEVQLAEFIKDESYFEEYDIVSPMNGDVLVRIMQASIPKYGRERVTLEQDPNTGEWVPGSEIINTMVINYVKIIRMDPEFDYADKRIQEGAVFSVPAADVIGEEWNPDFLHLVNTFGKTGDQGKLIHIPDGMRQKIDAIEINWKKYMFIHPNHLIATPEDKLTYMIPRPKLRAAIDTNRVLQKTSATRTSRKPSKNRKK